ncbi:MAG: hypothetical protein GEU94_00795 [Micromonosporaceae bacterium]|nr:hypothetical protein [Micromonosporaceae bacterium]
MAHQLHYASVPRGVTDRAGFQFTARSPGAPVEAERLIERFMTYRPPAGLAVEQCPVSLAYDHTPHGAIAVCCRYLGADYTGRPGNFLGHAVVADPDELDGVRPIELWRAPWWARRPADSLPTVDALAPGAAIDPERVSLLLAAGGAESYRLLAALIDAARDTLAGQAGPVMLISDDVDRIALWIAAVSYSLPFGVTRTMSFVTYTSDPLAARHHLVGATPAAWAASRSDGAAYVLSDCGRAGPPAQRLPEPPSPYAHAAAEAWGAGDLAAIDTLCAVAATGVRSAGRGAARGGGLDAAAALLALCRGEPVDDQHQGSALRLLDALPEIDRARLLDRTAASLTAADERAVTALFDGSSGEQLADLLVDRDWSAAPSVARLVYSRHGRRHRERRAEMAERLVELGAPDSPDVAQDVADLWADADPSPVECVRLLERLDRHHAGPDLAVTADNAAVRDIVARAFANADLAEGSTSQLARAVASRYPAPTSSDEEWPPPGPPGPADPPADPSERPASAAVADPAQPHALAAGARAVLAAAGAVECCADEAAPERIAEHLDRLTWWRPHADPALASRTLRRAAAELAGQPVATRLAVLRAASPRSRELLVADWLSHTPDEPATRTDLAEIAVRLRALDVAVPPLTEYLVALARRPFAFRRVHSAMGGRGPGLADELRAMVNDAGGGWRAVFRRPAGS